MDEPSVGLVEPVEDELFPVEGLLVDDELSVELELLLLLLDALVVLLFIFALILSSVVVLSLSEPISSTIFSLESIFKVGSVWLLELFNLSLIVDSTSFIGVDILFLLIEALELLVIFSPIKSTTRNKIIDIIKIIIEMFWIFSFFIFIIQFLLCV